MLNEYETENFHLFNQSTIAALVFNCMIYSFKLPRHLSYMKPVLSKVWRKYGLLYVITIILKVVMAETITGPHPPMTQPRVVTQCPVREVCDTMLVLSGSLLQWCVMINLICRLVTATALEPACHALIFSRGIFQSSSMTVVQYWYYIYYGYMEYRLGVDCCNAIIFS